jgi:hypothetical protein
MATIYIKAEDDQKLELLAENGNRNKASQLTLLLDNEIQRLGIPADAKPSSDGNNLTQINNSNQEKNTGVA